MIDAGTTVFYDGWAVDGVEAARSAVSRQSEAAFAAGARVLDVGCVIAAASRRHTPALAGTRHIAMPVHRAPGGSQCRRTAGYACG